MVQRGEDAQAAALWAPAAPRGYVGLDPGLVDEDQAVRACSRAKRFFRWASFPRAAKRTTMADLRSGDARRSPERLCCGRSQRSGKAVSARISISARNGSESFRKPPDQIAGPSRRYATRSGEWIDLDIWIQMPPRPTSACRRLGLHTSDCSPLIQGRAISACQPAESSMT